MKKKIIIIFIFLLFLAFIFISFNFFIKKFHYMKINYDKLKQQIIINKIEKKDIADSIKIDGVDCLYDKKSNTYYYSINKKYINKKKKMNIEVKSQKNIAYIVNGYVNEFNTKIDLSKKTKILVYNNKYYYEYKIIFTISPLINIELNKFIDDEDVEGKFTLLDGNYMSRDNDIGYKYKSSMNIHIRGSNSRIYDKKSYKLEFNSNNKVSLLDMRKDNDWILDAMYIDRSKLKNKFGSDIWNMINNNQNINNDMKGEYTEVFINEEYIGLYLLKEPIDQKTVNLNNDGIIVKSVSSITDEQISKLKKFDDEIIKSNHKFNFEMKKNISSLNWNNFLKKYKEYYNGNSKDFSINKTFDSDNYVNYHLFIIIINAIDNISNNEYLSMQNKDSNILITPWDLDMAFGTEYSKKVLSNFSSNSVIDSIINQKTPKYNKLISERYIELRKNVLTKDVFNRLLDSYLEELTNSNATIRDSKKWYKYNIKKEIEDIRNWIYNRLNYLDKYFEIKYCKLEKED